MVFGGGAGRGLGCVAEGSRGRCMEVGCGLWPRSPDARGNHLRGFYKAPHPRGPLDQSNPPGRGAAWASLSREASQ